MTRIQYFGRYQGTSITIYLVAREVELVPESEHEVVIRMHDLLSVYFDNLDDLTASFRGVDPIFETL